MKTDEIFDFTIENLGPCTIQSPIKLSTVQGDYTANYVRDDSYVIANVNVYDASKPIVMDSSNLMEKAGPREKIYFDPTHAKAGICTCGGLCPGLNDVIRAIVRCLNTRYGVKTIKGYQYGFRAAFPRQDEISEFGGIRFSFPAKCAILSIEICITGADTMFGKMMNSFYYGKSGKGDFRKEDLPKTRWQLFWEMLRVRLSALCRLNLMCIAAWLPMIILVGYCVSTVFNGMVVASEYTTYLETGDMGNLTEAQIKAIAEMGVDVNQILAEVLRGMIFNFCIWCIPNCLFINN